MKWPIRIIIALLLGIFIFFLFSTYVLPASDIKYKFNITPKDPIKEINDDKITKIISKITSSTPSEIVANDSRRNTYTKLDSKYVVPPTGKVVLANLDQKTINVIEDGKLIKSMNIVSIGKPNKYYETPGGIYKIKSWETNHYSSLGHVYMPWSMQFSGNYFIHGIPYHEDGEKVSTQYSGGCIRLEDEDAKFIYDFSDKSTYVLVLKNEDTSISSLNIASSSEDSNIRINNDAITKNITLQNSTDTQLSNQVKKYSDKYNTVLAYDLSTNIYYTSISNLDMAATDTNITDLAITLTALDNVSQERTTADSDGIQVKQLTLLPKLLSGDSFTRKQTTNYIGNNIFQAYLDNKMKSIGLENTYIDVINSRSTTTLMDIMYTLRYIYIYKPYIMSLDESAGTGLIWQYNVGGGYMADIVKGQHKDFLVIYR